MPHVHGLSCEASDAVACERTTRAGNPTAYAIKRSLRAHPPTHSVVQLQWHLMSPARVGTSELAANLNAVLRIWCPVNAVSRVCEGAVAVCGVACTWAVARVMLQNGVDGIARDRGCWWSTRRGHRLCGHGEPKVGLEAVRW